jgi:hypothetical protein
VVVDAEGGPGSGGAGGATGAGGAPNGVTGTGTGTGTGSSGVGGSGGAPGGTTLNPLDKQESIHLTNGNLTARSSPGSFNDSVRATTAHDAGRWYFEALLEKSDQPFQAVGIADIQASLEDAAGYVSLGCSYDVSGLIVCDFGASFVSAEPASEGDVIGVAVDLDQHLVYFRRNGAWVGGASPEQGNGFPSGAAPMLPMVTMSEQDRITTNFGASPFASPPPEGYAAGY